MSTDALRANQKRDPVASGLVLVLQATTSCDKNEHEDYVEQDDDGGCDCEVEPDTHPWPLRQRTEVPLARSAP